MITGIGHTAYNVENMEKSLNFYCDVLGFKKLFETHNDQDEPWIVYLKICDHQFIELFYNGIPGVDNDTSVVTGYNHLCLEVDDINEIVERMNKEGIPVDSGPRRGKDTNWQCWVRDPDGNRIEFMQLNPESPQAKLK